MKLLAFSAALIAAANAVKLQYCEYDSDGMMHHETATGSVIKSELIDNSAALATLKAMMGGTSTTTTASAPTPVPIVVSTISTPVQPAIVDPITAPASAPAPAPAPTPAPLPVQAPAPVTAPAL